MFVQFAHFSPSLFTIHGEMVEETYDLDERNNGLVSSASFVNKEHRGDPTQTNNDKNRLNRVKTCLINYVASVINMNGTRFIVHEGT